MHEEVQRSHSPPKRGIVNPVSGGSSKDLGRQAFLYQSVVVWGVVCTALEGTHLRVLPRGQRMFEVGVRGTPERDMLLLGA